jgi:hypothetical protein
MRPSLEGIIYPNNDQLAAAREIIRNHPDDEPVSIHQLLNELPDRPEMTDEVDWVIGVSTNFGPTPHIHRVDSDWIEFMWSDDLR